VTVRLYDTRTQGLRDFEPLVPGKVGMYVCGPTVYKSPHIGHMVGPVIFDAVKRYLAYKGYEVTWVVNITDVEDKLIEAAAKVDQPVEVVAAKYTAEFFDVLKSLGIETIDQFPKASEHISEIIAMCEKLIERNHAYAVEGSVYFDVTKDADYGKLSHRKVEEQESGLRDITGAGGKRNPADFVLWKAAKPGEPAWDSPWGKGRPGWHIECSAMSIKYLGETFDIHGGGMDLMFPHHENELAQSESCTGHTFAKYWMHWGLTKLKTKLASGEWADEKMSGSIGNVVPAAKLIEEHGAELIRYMLLSTHYRRPIDFSDEVVESSKKGLAVFTRLFERVERLTGKKLHELGPDMDLSASAILETEHAPFARAVLGLKMKFLEMMDDDFNTAGAIAVLHELTGEINSHIEKHEIEKSKHNDLIAQVLAATSTLRNVGSVIGLFRLAPSASGGGNKDAGLLDQVMTLVIQLRKDARANKNFTLADAIRDGLSKIGVTLEDRPDGTGWRKG
jgi:cysteinyl-tRNA synthetase